MGFLAVLRLWVQVLAFQIPLLAQDQREPYICTLTNSPLLGPYLKPPPHPHSKDFFFYFPKLKSDSCSYKLRINKRDFAIWLVQNPSYK